MTIYWRYDLGLDGTTLLVYLAFSSPLVENTVPFIDDHQRDTPMRFSLTDAAVTPGRIQREVIARVRQVRDAADRYVAVMAAHGGGQNEWIQA